MNQRPRHPEPEKVGQKAHLEAVKDEIAKILDPKFMPPAAAYFEPVRILTLDRRVNN